MEASLSSDGGSQISADFNREAELDRRIAEGSDRKTDASISKRKEDVSFMFFSFTVLVRYLYVGSTLN